METERNNNPAPEKKEKAYPHSEEAERAMLCCILTDAEVANDMVPKLDVQDFYGARNRDVFTACKALLATSVIDAITVNDWLERNGKSDQNLMDYLVQLTSEVPSAANYMQYFDVLRRDTLLRSLISMSYSIIRDAQSAADVHEVMEHAEKQIFSISTQVFGGDLVQIGSASSEVMGRIDDLMLDKNAFRGLMTHYTQLDKLMNGFQKGNLIILAARPSVGKTAFALNIVANLLQYSPEKRVAFFNLEMSGAELAQRLMSISSNVTMNAISSGNLTDRDQEEMWNVHKKLAESKIFVDDSSMETPGDIISKCRRLATLEHGLDLVIIDYLQLMGSDRRGGEVNKQQEVSDISRQLKILARELNCPVLVLSQMSRGIEQRDDKTPKLSDLRESGAIEQDADVVFFLSRENENDFGKQDYAVLLDVSKHRNGQLNVIRFDWHGAHVRFCESQDQTVNRVFKTNKKQ